MPRQRKLADPVAVLSRDGSKLANTVRALGGQSAVAAMIGRSQAIVWAYVHGTRAVPPDVAAFLQSAALTIANDQLGAAEDCAALLAEAKRRRERVKLASRTRYYERFGRYPVPARGGKTP